MYWEMFIIAIGIVYVFITGCVTLLSRSLMGREKIRITIMTACIFVCSYNITDMFWPYDISPGEECHRYAEEAQKDPKKYGCANTPGEPGYDPLKEETSYFAIGIYSNFFGFPPWVVSCSLALAGSFFGINWAKRGQKNLQALLRKKWEKTLLTGLIILPSLICYEFYKLFYELDLAYNRYNTNNHMGGILQIILLLTLALVSFSFSALFSIKFYLLGDRTQSGTAND